MTTWADEYVTLLEDCEKRSERLSDWELGFVDSLQRQLAEGRRPSAKQIETLDTIWERATRAELLEALNDLTLNVSEAMKTGGWVPTPLHESFWGSMCTAMSVAKKAAEGAR